MNKATIYHFIGIKGTGMSALAHVVKGSGYQVQGSDVEEHFFTQDGLEADHIKILPFDPDNIKPGMEVILGNAFKDDHPEAVRARELGLKVTRYHQFLGEWIKDYTSIAITGSHGKTSTTGLMAHVLGDNFPISYLIGDGEGHGDRDAKYFVLEADEYRRHFLAYHPDYAIFTNVDFDHPDYYQNIEEVFEANREFAQQVKKKAIAYGDDPYLQRFKGHCDVWYYGFNEEYDIVAKDLVRDTDGSQFDVYIHENYYGHFKIKQFGQHNVLNSLAVIGFCYLEGISAEKVQTSLLSYGGVKRRFNEYPMGDVTVIDDYAHHPSEIRATIDAARQEYPDREIVSIFQPHTYSRVKALKDEFADALNQSDVVYLCDIFASARETDHHEVSSEDILKEVDKPAYMLDYDDVSPLLQYHNAVLLFMGAGDVMKYADRYRQLRKESEEK